MTISWPPIQVFGPVFTAGIPIVSETLPLPTVTQPGGTVIGYVPPGTGPATPPPPPQFIDLDGEGIPGGARIPNPPIATIGPTARTGLVTADPFLDNRLTDNRKGQAFLTLDGDQVHVIGQLYTAGLPVAPFGFVPTLLRFASAVQYAPPDGLTLEALADELDPSVEIPFSTDVMRVIFPGLSFDEQNAADFPTFNQYLRVDWTWTAAAGGVVITGESEGRLSGGAGIVRE